MSVKAFAAVAALAMSACVGAPSPSPDDLYAWHRAPLPPDPAFASKALVECRMNEELVPQVVLQDQRTAWQAAFIVSAPGWTGHCVVNVDGASSTGWQSEPLPELQGQLVVDEEAYGSDAMLEGGRVAPGVLQVEVGLADGTTVIASVANGHWLAWWTGDARADVIRATSMSGTVQTLTRSPEGWAVR